MIAELSELLDGALLDVSGQPLFQIGRTKVVVVVLAGEEIVDRGQDHVARGEGGLIRPAPDSQVPGVHCTLGGIAPAQAIC